MYMHFVFTWLQNMKCIVHVDADVNSAGIKHYNKCCLQMLCRPFRHLMIWYRQTAVLRLLEQC